MVNTMTTNSTSPTGTYGIKHGGLMRCCLKSLDDEMVHRKDYHQVFGAEDEILKCRWCDSEMIYKEGYWQWNQK